MPNFKKTISYTPYTKVNTLLRRFFWFGVVFCAFSLAFYVYSVYLTVDLSYKISAEMRRFENETVAYQQIEQRYISKLEGLRGEGKKTLGLAPPSSKAFIDRYTAVAKLDI